MRFTGGFMMSRRYELLLTDRKEGVFRVNRPEGDRFDRPYVVPVDFTGEVRCLWENRIPRGKVTLIEGPGGSGKSRHR